MADLENELDEIIAREKPGFKRVQKAAVASDAGNTADLIRKYLGGGKAANNPGEGAAEAGSDLAIVHVRPEQESDDPRQNVPKAVVISRSKKKIVGEQG